MIRTIQRSLVAVALLALIAAPASAGMLEVGSKAPEFSLTDSQGKTHSLKDYEGKIVVLEWTNPQCPFVVDQYKQGTMAKLAEQFQEKDVVWLAVDSSHFVTAESANAWIEKNEIQYPILLDAAGTVGRSYHAKTTPHMFVIGADGMLLYNGAIDDDNKIGSPATTNFVESALANALNGKTIEKVSTKPYGCSVKYAEKAAEPKAAS